MKFLITRFCKQGHQERISAAAANIYVNPKGQDLTRTLIFLYKPPRRFIIATKTKQHRHSPVIEHRKPPTRTRRAISLNPIPWHGNYLNSSQYHVVFTNTTSSSLAFAFLTSHTVLFSAGLMEIGSRTTRDSRDSLSVSLIARLLVLGFCAFARYRPLRVIVCSCG